MKTLKIYHHYEEGAPQLIEEWSVGDDGVAYMDYSLVDSPSHPFVKDKNGHPVDSRDGAQYLEALKNTVNKSTYWSAE